MKKLLLLLTIILLIPVVEATEYNIQHNASANGTCDVEWSNPENVYESDDVRASASSTTTGTYTCEIKNYTFDIPSGADIKEVLVKVETYSSNTADENLVIRVYNGTDWSETYSVDYTGTEAIYTKNVTNAFDWTPEMLNNTNFMTRMDFSYVEPVVEGCFPNQTYFISWNESACNPLNPINCSSMPWILKNVEKAEIGDWILASNHWEGIHWEKIATVTKHYGNWTIYDIWSGKVKIKYKDEKDRKKEYEWAHHTKVTGNHPALIWRNNTWIKIPSEEIVIGDANRHINHEEIELEPGQFIPIEKHMLSTEEIYKITKEDITGYVYDIRTNDSRDYMFMTTITEQEFAGLKYLEEKYNVNLGSYIDPGVVGKWTTYVDWLPVNVTYTIDTAPQYSNNQTNTTIAGKPANFTLDWTDDVGLSGYIFSTNNSGTWANASFVSFSGTSNTAWNVTTLNDTVGALVQWCYYANDTSDNWNRSSCDDPFNLTTTSAVTVYRENITQAITISSSKIDKSILEEDLSQPLTLDNIRTSLANVITDLKQQISTSFSTSSIMNYIQSISQSLTESFSRIATYIPTIAVAISTAIATTTVAVTTFMDILSQAVTGIVAVTPVSTLYESLSQALTATPSMMIEYISTIPKSISVSISSALSSVASFMSESAQSIPILSEITELLSRLKQGGPIPTIKPVEIIEREIEKPTITPYITFGLVGLSYYYRKKGKEKMNLIKKEIEKEKKRIKLKRRRTSPKMIRLVKLFKENKNRYEFATLVLVLSAIVLGWFAGGWIII